MGKSFVVHKPSLVCLSIGICGLVLASAPVRSQQGPVVSNGPTIRGHANTVYRSRWIDNESDQDFYQYWDVEVEDLIPGHARGAFSLRLNTDLDGRVGSAPGAGTYLFDRDPFYSVDDARDDREYVDLFTGYLDFYNGTPDNGFLRIGRQYLYEFDYIHADAIKLELPITASATVKAFAGQAVSNYSGHTEDWTAGIGLEIRQSARSKWWFEFHRYEDDIADSDSYAIETWQRPWEGAYFHAKFRGLDGDARDLTVNMSQYFEPLDLTILMDYKRLFSELGDESRHDSPLYRSGLLEQRPYNFYGLRFDKAMPCNFGLSGGVGVQRVSEDHQDYGNHDYEHADLTLSYYPSKKWFYSISGEWWNTDPDSSFFGYTGEIGYRPNKCIEWTLGSSYGNYVFRYEDERFDALFRESPTVKTYYAGLRWKLNDTSRLRVNLEMEDDDLDNDYYTLRMSWGQSF